MNIQLFHLPFLVILAGIVWLSGYNSGYNNGFEWRTQQCEAEMARITNQGEIK